jgi:ubiquitin thioesterase protein OTUB1
MENVDGEVRDESSHRLETCHQGVVLTYLVTAVAFGYFEALIRQNSVTTFEEEEARMCLLRSIVQDAGMSSEVCDDFFEEAIDLLKKLAKSLATGTAENLLLDTFNNEGVQEYLVFCMKVNDAAFSLSIH